MTLSRRPSAALLAAALAAAAAVPAAAGATTLTLSYTGADPDDRYVTSTGTGTLSFDGSGSLGLANLTGFSFAFTVTSADPSLRYTDTFTCGRADLTSFTATTAGATLSALALRTDYQSPPDQFLAPEYLIVRSLGAGGLVSYFGPGDDAQHGTLAVAPVPEPASWALLLAGFAAVGVAMRRGRTQPRFA